MPLPADEKIVALSNQILQKFEALFGAHPGFRLAHAKGIMLNGTFTPTAEAASLNRAPHLNRPSSPVTVRFSNSTGIPVIPDNDPNADPRGCAVRFYLGEPRAYRYRCRFTPTLFLRERGRTFWSLVGDYPNRFDSYSGLAVGKVPRHSSRSVGVCAGAEATGFELRPGDVFCPDRCEVHQQGWRRPLRPVPYSSGSRQPSPGGCGGGGEGAELFVR